MENLIEKHYQHYLGIVKLNEKDMTLTQKTEMKRAFTAGMSAMFVVMMSGLGLGVTLEDYKQQLSIFWEQEILNHENNG